jgi:hypothetical protein
MASGFRKNRSQAHRFVLTGQETGEQKILKFQLPFAIPHRLRIIFYIPLIILIFGHPLANDLNTVLAQESFESNIEGLVLSKASGSPIAAAFVELPDFQLSSITNDRGEFSFYNISIPEMIYPTTIHIQTPGFGKWSIKSVRLVANDTLLLEANLETEPVSITVPEINREEQFATNFLQAEAYRLNATLSQLDEPLPQTIRVRMTDNVAVCDPNAAYTVEVVDFNEYVKNVLPNEWYSSWPYEALHAGAMAVKMYAWQIVAAGGRYDDADVFNSVCDQVYIPGVAYYRTNKAIDFTWNWRLTHEDDGTLFRTHYMAYYYYCEKYGWQGYCMGQWETYYHSEGNNGYEKLTWDEMLFKYYWDSQLSFIPRLPTSGFMLHFYGNGWGDFDRVKILLDDPQNGDLPVDIGNTDFTIEWWMKALPSENTSTTCTPGDDHWMEGNVILDRDLDGVGDYGEYGVFLMEGRIAFGVNNGTTSETICGALPVSDGLWHHIAVTRRASDGQMRIFVDGLLDIEGIGPTGDISYRDGRLTQYPEQDPYLVIGARKLDQGLSYSGWIDEMRISNLIRYDAPFELPIEPFQSDANTMALYHFDTGYGNLVHDLSGAPDGPSDGIRIYGGDPNNGPEWEVSSLFPDERLYLPLIIR